MRPVIIERASACCLGDLAQARHVVAQQQDVGDEPDDEGHGEPPVAGRREHDGAAEVEDDIDQHVEHLHHHFAHRQRGLHQLGGDAAGELVLEIAHRLPDEIAMAHPADALRIVAQQRLVDDQRRERVDVSGMANSTTAPIQKSVRAVRSRGRSRGSDRPSQSTMLPMKPNITISSDAMSRRADGHGDQPALGALRIVQTEGHEALGRLLGRRTVGYGSRRRSNQPNMQVT